MGYPEDNFHGATGGRGKGGPGGGRKPKLVKAWLKECNIERADAVAILKNLLFDRTVDEMNALLENEKDTVSVATYALIKAAINAAKKGNYQVIAQMFEFIYGKNLQRVDISGAPASVVILPEKDALDDAELETPAETGPGA
jgi:hypothetical protein